MDGSLDYDYDEVLRRSAHHVVSDALAGIGGMARVRYAPTR